MRKIFSIILIFTIGAQCLLLPLSARAAVKSSAIAFTGCATGNIAGNYLSGRVAGLVSSIKDRIKGRITDQISSGLTSVPVTDSGVKGSQDSGNAQDFTKAYVTDVIARCAARTILSVMVGNIYKVMRTSGRDGGVTFIRNWSNFQLAAQYRGENIFRAELSTAQLCDYLSDGIKRSFGVDPKKKTPITKQSTRIDSLQPFSLEAKCTMPAGFSLENYQQDFAGNGGWDAYARMLEPQNNAWGLSAISRNEISKQRALAVSADNNQAVAGSGYLGTSGRGKSDSCAVKSPSGADCIVYNDIKTTGSYIAANIAAGINAELAWITSAQGLGSIVANLTEVLLNRLLDEGGPDEGLPRTADETGGVDLGSVGPSVTPDAPGGGTCADPGNTTANYAAQLNTAESTVLNNNPTLANSLNDIPNSTEFVSAVALQLKSSGMEASSSVKSGNDVTHTENYVAVWQSQDIAIERYEAVNHAGDGDMTIKNAAQAEYSGDIPLTCAN